MHLGNFDKLIKLFVCTYVVHTHIGEKCLCCILVTSYCIFASLVVDYLSVFDDCVFWISWVFCVMQLANEIQCVHMCNSSIRICITNKWYYFIFHYIQNQVLFPVLQMEMVGNTGLDCCFRNANDIEERNRRMILIICAVVGDTSEIVGALYVVVHEKQMAYAS